MVEVCSLKPHPLPCIVKTENYDIITCSCYTLTHTDLYVESHKQLRKTSNRSKKLSLCSMID